MEADLKLLKTQPIVEVARKALPHYGTFLDEHGVSGVPLLVDDVEAALLASLREALDQKDADAAAVTQARELIEAVKASAAKPATVTPPEL
jgi:chorismate mutase